MSGLCPHHGRSLVPRKVEDGRTVEIYLACHGLWLAPALVAGLVGHALKTSAVAALPSARAFSALPCPVDGSGMRALRSAGVEIDLCGRCGGVWLDAGELERLRAPAAAAGSDFIEAAEGALELASDLGEGLLDSHLPGWLAGSPDAPAARSSLGALTVSSTLGVERTDAAAAVDSTSGILDGAGDALGAVFAFVGDALSSL